MNPFLQRLLIAAVQMVLVWLAGHLGVESTKEEVASAALLIGGAIWVIWTTFTSHRFGVTAQSMGQATHDEVKAQIEKGCAPSVLTPADQVPKA